MTSLVIGWCSGFTLLTKLTLVQNTCLWQINVKRYIRMGITIYKIFIWGGISSVIWSEIMFYDSAVMSPYNKISDHITDNIPPPPPPKKNFEYSYPPTFLTPEFLSWKYIHISGKIRSWNTVCKEKSEKSLKYSSAKLYTKYILMF